MNLQEHVELIREVFYYLRRFRGATFVVKVDYRALQAPHAPLLVRDIALLRQAGINVILVPGAKERIDEICRQYGISWEEKDGVRISPEEAMPFIEMAAFDVSTRLMTALAGEGIHAVVGNWVRARSLGVIDGVDFLRTGRVERVNIEPVVKLLHDEIVPIFPCVGWNAQGKPYNISSNELAGTIAAQVSAEKLFYLIDRPGYRAADLLLPEGVVLTEEGYISRLTVEQAEALLEMNPGSRSHLEHIAHASRACRAGVDRVHILNAMIDGVLLKEIFSNLGVGTMIHRNEFESIRAMREEDVPAVLRLMDPLIREGVLLPRSADQLRNEYQNFYVYELDGSIYGCGALYIYGKEGEVAGLAMDSTVRHLGIGRRLTTFLIDQARKAGLKRLFALTTQASDWFEQMGFSLSTPEELPPERRRRYLPSRNSRVYVKDLAQG
ncbi:amino-acid N-acetyltransferase [Spirochaeta thermophila DSM 6578]|uniref:amino-acid N-acetyltransferase n=1 Tax=Winmispira thermophila (strain ATCC 700085 / DSM 6578 / Z-1203) TaxID=869211 RepID=G0GCJ6_WINT7|nr:amino-acid N-acetyltransferase [Spirochaeta thermophila]AEJ62062.1 amino-acid N-acetyltransferase [Spirochaeta thermophila DSM 6578]